MVKKTTKKKKVKMTTWPKVGNKMYTKQYFRIPGKKTRVMRFREVKLDKTGRPKGKGKLINPYYKGKKLK